MKKINVSHVFGVQYTEDKYMSRHTSKQFDENSTVKEILDFLETIHNADISSAIITILE